MKKALRIASASIMVLAMLFSCIVFPNVTQAAPSKAKVTISSPVKVKNGQTGKYTLYQIKGKKASVQIKAKASSGKVSFTSSDRSIVTVNSKGVMKTTGKKTGKALVTAYSTKNPKAKATILVTIANFAPKLSKTSLTVKEHASATLKVTGQGVKSVVFKSSNPKIASVDRNGKVTGVAEGSAVITADVASTSGVKTTLAAKVTVAKAIFKFYLTRHGETVFNTMEVGQGWTDSPLTKDSKDKKGNVVYGGISMAKQLGKSMAKIPFDKAYSSDLGRAHDTAKYIVAGRNIPIILDANLRETNLGDLEGRPRSEDTVSSYVRFQTDTGYIPEGGENMKQTGDRCAVAIERIIKENPSGGTFLVTSHGGTITAYLDKLIGYRAYGGYPNCDQRWKDFLDKWGGSLPNCGVCELTYADGKMTVDTLGDTTWLGEMAPIPDSEQPEPEYTFYLVRHGETVFNTLGISQGQSDSPLTKDSVDKKGNIVYGGISMAQKLHDTMADIDFDKCYSSDLGRTRATAQYILEGRKVPIILDTNLRETSCGSLEGKVDPKDSSVRIGWEVGYKDEGGETMHQTADRVATAMDRIIAENKNGGTFLVTSHGGAILTYLDSLIGPNAPGHNGEFSKADPLFLKFIGDWGGAMPNCAVSIVKYSKSNGFTVTKISDTSYLGEMAPPLPAEEEAPEYEFFITRHGETIANTLDIGQGWSDSPLTDDTKNKEGKITAYGGVSMAKKLGENMADIDFDKAYTSDLGRTRQTTELILEGRDVPVIMNKNLRETNLGSLENKGSEADPKGFSVRVADDIGWTDVGGESIPQTGDRMLTALNQIIKENKKGGTFLVTSHGGAITALLDKLIGFRAGANMDPRWMPFIQNGASMPNCCVTHVLYKDGVFTVDYFGDTRFLDGLVPEAEPDEPEYTFYLTRHGETMFNVLGLAQGWCDSPLTDDTEDPETHEITKYGGISMAKELGKNMKDIPFDKCYTSISERAYDTAKYIIGDRKIPLIIDENLKETNCGSVEGTKDTVNFMDRIGWDAGYKNEGGESMHMTADRVALAMDRIIKENKKGGMFLVTSHGGAILSYLDSLFGPNAEGNEGVLANADPKFQEFMATWHGSMPNCAVSIVQYSKATGFTLTSISDTQYLGDLAPTP